MRCVVQRVLSASVTTTLPDGSPYRASIEHGFLILVGVRTDDMEEDSRYLSGKVAGLRIFEDQDGKLNRSLLDAGGSVLVVSNFTLYGDCRKGLRPSFTEAAAGTPAERLYLDFADRISRAGIPVILGVFGADMLVELVNDGPVTLILDSRKQF